MSKIQLTGDSNPFDPLLDNDQQLIALQRALSYNHNFSLFCVVCNSNESRRQIIDKLKSNINEEIGELQLYNPVENLYDELRLWLKEKSTPPKCIMVTGLESWLPTGKKGDSHPFIKNLDAVRNHFSLVYSGTLILWLSEKLLDVVSMGAPNFLSIRSGIFYFVDQKITKTQDRWEKNSLADIDHQGLSYEERLRRLETLKEILKELQEIPEKNRDLKRERSLQNSIIEILYSLARYHESEPLMRRALQIDETSYGKDHPNVAIRLNNLAQLLQATNRLTEAEPLMRRALQIDETSYGKDHPGVAIRLNNLAQLLADTNRLTEAEPLMRRALRIDEASYGIDHPEVAIDLNNLAQLLTDTNRLTEAEPLMRRALQIDETFYGKDHPKLAIRLNNLAQLLADTNRLTEAEPLMRRALKIDEVSYGKDHPNVARNLNNLAVLLAHTNRLTEAEPLMRRALQIDETSYGKDHPNVARDLNNLAQLLADTNRLTEAEPLMRRGLQIVEASYGKDHPNVAIGLNNLAQLLADTNRLTEAEPFRRKGVEILLEFILTNGHQHPHLRVLMENYLGLLKEMGKSDDEIQSLLSDLTKQHGITFEELDL
jgi:tetratricopeptide (TPR) repeat protein